MGSASLFYDDPAVHCEDAVPANRARGIDPDERVAMFRGVRQQSGAGTVRSLPIRAALAEQIAGGGNEHRPYDKEQENDEVFHRRTAVGSVGCTQYVVLRPGSAR